MLSLCFEARLECLMFARSMAQRAKLLHEVEGSLIGYVLLCLGACPHQ